jgi:branched-chain amino acid transport system permease protein
MIFCAVIGGIGTLEGPVLGAIVFFLLQDRLADSGTLYLVGLGALAITIAAFLPAGLWGEAQKRLGLTMFPVGHRLVLQDASTRADAPSASSAAAAGGEGPRAGPQRHKSEQPHRPAESASPAANPTDPP